MREQLHLENSFIVYEQEQVRSGDASDTFPRDQISLTRKIPLYMYTPIQQGIRVQNTEKKGRL